MSRKYFQFCVYGSVHRLSILIIVQRDATQGSLSIILQVHSTCFGCQPHPASGVHKTVTTASGLVKLFVHLPPSNLAKLAASRWTIINISTFKLISCYDKTNPNISLHSLSRIQLEKLQQTLRESVVCTAPFMVATCPQTGSPN